jgi:hypothetical protein
MTKFDLLFQKAKDGNIKLLSGINLAVLLQKEGKLIDALNVYSSIYVDYAGLMPLDEVYDRIKYLCD